MSKIAFLLFFVSIYILTSCHRKEDSFYAEEVPLLNLTDTHIEPADLLNGLGWITIDVNANGNYTGINDPKYIINISGNNDAYCHPDVEYFPEGFNGYKYWMVFTPYFGAVGTAQVSKRFENPTVVVSNNGINWTSPAGIENPIVRTPSVEESFLENKTDPKQGFWSDPDWLFTNNQFNLYYRGSFVSADALKKRGAKSKNNTEKTKANAQRTIVRQTSANGINWTPLEVVYNSNAPYTPPNDHLVSPTFIKRDNGYVSYEVEINTGKKNFKGTEPSYVIQRVSNDGLNFSVFNKSKIVNFINTPWKEIDQSYAPWHIHATYTDGYYFLCLAVGDIKKFTANQLYLAYSADGLNFKVLPKPMISQEAYRSAIFPMSTDNESIHFGSILAYKTGQFQYKEFTLNKAKLDASLK